MENEKGMTQNESKEPLYHLMLWNNEICYHHEIVNGLLDICKIDEQVAYRVMEIADKHDLKSYNENAIILTGTERELVIMQQQLTAVNIKTSIVMVKTNLE